MAEPRERVDLALEASAYQDAWQTWFQHKVGDAEVARLLEVELLSHGLVYYGHPRHRPWSESAERLSEGTKDYRTELAIVGETIQFLCQALKKLLTPTTSRDSFSMYLDTLLQSPDVLNDSLLKQGRFHSASASLSALYDGMQGLLPVVEIALSAHRVPERVFYGIHQLLAREIAGSGVFSLRPWRRENGMLDLSPVGLDVLEQARQVSLSECCVLPVSELCESSAEIAWLAQQSQRAVIPGFVLVGFAGVHARLYHLGEVISHSFSMRTEAAQAAFGSAEQELLSRVFRVFMASVSMLCGEIAALMKRELGGFLQEGTQVRSSSSSLDADKIVIKVTGDAQNVLYEVLEFWCRSLQSQFGIDALGASELRCRTFIERYEHDLALLSYLLGGFLDRVKVLNKKPEDLRDLSKYKEIDDFRRLFRTLHYISLSALPEETRQIDRLLHEVLRGIGHGGLSVRRLGNVCESSHRHLENLRQKFPKTKETKSSRESKRKLRAGVAQLVEAI